VNTKRKPQDKKMNACTDEDIKELLPIHLEQGLDGPERVRVEAHLNRCEDCRTELSLLRITAESTVPDPGAAFWSAMPDRVYRAVQRNKAKKWPFDVTWLVDRLSLPRWVFGAAAVGTVLIVSWLAVHSLQHGHEMRGSQGYDVYNEPVVADEVPINELDDDQLDTVAAWAGTELASFAREASPVMASISETDIAEELAELNTREAERLSAMLDQWKEEGS
jgi:anti-sigma factor RsiW